MTAKAARGRADGRGILGVEGRRAAIKMKIGAAFEEPDATVPAENTVVVAGGADFFRFGDAGFGDGFQLVCHGTSSCNCKSGESLLLAANLSKQHRQRIVKFVHHALLERDDGVIRDVNLLRANLRAAFRDVAKSEAEFVLEQRGAVAAVERMHIEAGDADEEAWTGELFLHVVLAKDVTHVLT